MQPRGVDRPSASEGGAGATAAGGDGEAGGVELSELGAAFDFVRL